MRIRNHRLTEHWFEKSKDIGGLLVDPRFVVMHYTAGGSGAASRDYMLLSPSAKQKRLGTARKVYASAHIVIDRDGSLWQIVPFNAMARHAGTSRWKGLTSLNRYSIGIEIANYGWLDRQGDGSYGRSDTPRFEAADVVVGNMPHSEQLKGWEPYTEAQLQSAEQLVDSLLHYYPTIQDIIGHQDIAPGRKFDPGPAFPMARFANLIDNRGTGTMGADETVAVERFTNIARLNIREGPGTEFEKLPESPLATGTELLKSDQQGEWYLVKTGGGDSINGWVHSGFLKLV